MKILCVIFIVGFAAIVIPSAAHLSAEEHSNRDAEEILRLHKELIESHKAYDVDKLFTPEADSVVTVNGGEVFFQTKKERIPRFKQYLENTSFEEYRDLIEPIVRVSKDGTLGWLIAQVKITGAHIDESKKSKPFDTVWAWIELYEKRNGRWYRIGDVSTLKQMDVKNTKETQNGKDL
jgi:hypothetical protein